MKKSNEKIKFTLDVITAVAIIVIAIAAPTLVDKLFAAIGL